VLTDIVPPIVANRAWVYARRAELELSKGESAAALAWAMLSQRLAPNNPAASRSIRIVRQRVSTLIPVVDTEVPVVAMSKVEGWFTADEAALLVRCATAAPRDAAGGVVELGSYRGRSTVAIALAIQRSGKPIRMTAIDPHADYAFGDGSNTYQSLIGTLADNGVEALVDVISARSVDVEFDKPLSMVFIDALHDESSVRADYRHVAPHLLPGGLILFHDYTDGFPGVVNVVNDLLLSGSYELVGFVDSLISLRRI
jgi:predicted O-methyltransferase YrrM